MEGVAVLFPTPTRNNPDDADIQADPIFAFIPGPSGGFLHRLLFRKKSPAEGRSS